MYWLALRALFGNAADFREARLQDGRFWTDRGERFEATPDLFGLGCSGLAIESMFEPVGFGRWLAQRTTIVVMPLNLDLVNKSVLLILVLVLVLDIVLGLILLMGLRSALEFGLLEQPWAQQSEICSAVRAIDPSLWADRLG